MDSYEFNAPQFSNFLLFDFEQEEDPYFETLHKLFKSTGMGDKNDIFDKPLKEHIVELKGSEKVHFGKRTSILCENEDGSSSYIMNQVFSHALDSLIPRSNENEPPLQKVKQKPHEEEAYLFSAKNAAKTPKKGKDIVLTQQGSAKKITVKEDRTYAGMVSVRASNRSTIVRPFSFQARDEEMFKRKQEKLQRALQETKTFTAFQARPAPSHILSSNQNKSNIYLPSPRRTAKKKQG